MTTHDEQESGDQQTTAGNYFVANYPPFGAWSPSDVPLVTARLNRPPANDVPLGLYVHIPFCRKRCDFCYFKVYTDNDAARVRHYVDAVVDELSRYRDLPLLAGRQVDFVYFGGGTPSYLSADQLQALFAGLQRHFSFANAREITFECEPGTLQQKKLDALRQVGVTRLSLGVENFNAEILQLNNRAHGAEHIEKAYAGARQVGFPQINIDLIAGMVGETDANWQACIERTRQLAPESVTIYQLEVPFNTTIYRRMQDGAAVAAPVADWPTKRRWVDEAFTALARDGYLVGSAYTCKKDSQVQFRYRDGLWHGADLLGIGVSSFSHLAGMHFQNEPDLPAWHARLDAGELPIHRGLVLSEEQRLIREFILQMKLGEVPTDYFQGKFGVDLRRHFAAPLRRHTELGFVEPGEGPIRLTRRGLLQIDGLLRDYFEAEHAGRRYA